jgi:hypothetical protein
MTALTFLNTHVTKGSTSNYCRETQIRCESVSILCYAVSRPSTVRTEEDPENSSHSSQHSLTAIIGAYSTCDY